jgi:transcription elongation factor Elf1
MGKTFTIEQVKTLCDEAWRQGYGHGRFHTEDNYEEWLDACLEQSNLTIEFIQETSKNPKLVLERVLYCPACGCEDIAQYDLSDEGKRLYRCDECETIFPEKI